MPRWLNVARRCLPGRYLLPDLEPRWVRPLYFILYLHLVMIIASVLGGAPARLLMVVFSMLEVPDRYTWPVFAFLAAWMGVWLVGGLVQGVTWLVHPPDARHEETS